MHDLALFMIFSALQTFSDTDQAHQNAESDQDPKLLVLGKAVS